MNGLLKVPMQFVILFIGVMVFVFYQFNQPPVFFNKVAKAEVEQSEYASDLAQLETEHTELFNAKKDVLTTLALQAQNDDEAAMRISQAEALELEAKSKVVREKVKSLVTQVNPKAETNDKDYIFMGFVMDNLPIGMIGLLFAVMFSAAMSSTASELNALASTTTIDLYQRSINKKGSDTHYVKSSRWFTLGWGLLAITFATYASLFENLIQAVNLLGSLFYGTILGIFIVAFYFKWIKGNAVFIAALLAESVVIYIHYLNANGEASGILEMGYLWYNIVGCLLVVVFGFLLQVLLPKSIKQ